MSRENSPLHTNNHLVKDKWKHLRKLCHQQALYRLLIVALIGLVIYYFWQWPSVQDFMEAIDDCEIPLFDFFCHYYPMSKAILLTERPVAGYFYSAFFALMLVPVGLLSVISAFWVWVGVQLLCLWTALTAPMQRLLNGVSKTKICYVGLLAISLPIFHNLAWGQISLLIVACILVAFDAYMAERRILAGCLLAFVAAIKYYPAIFLVYFLLKRDFRVLAAFCAAGIVFFAAFPAAILGPSDWLAFHNAIKSAIDQSSWISNNVNSQYIVHVGLRYLQLIHPSDTNTLFALVLKLIGFAITGLNVISVWRLQQRSDSGEVVLSLSAGFLALPFLLKTSWPHYFCFLPFCQTVLLARVLKTYRIDLVSKTLSGLVLLSIVASSTFLFNCFPHWSDYSRYGLLFFSNLLLLPPLYTIALRGVIENGEGVSSRPVGGPQAETWLKIFARKHV